MTTSFLAQRGVRTPTREPGGIGGWRIVAQEHGEDRSPIPSRQFSSEVRIEHL